MRKKMNRFNRWRFLKRGKPNEYYKSVLKEEMYHCSFKEQKQGAKWVKLTDWSTTNTKINCKKNSAHCL